MDPLAALLSERPPRQLSESELRARIELLEDTARRIEESEGADVAKMLMADVKKVLEADRQRDPAWFEDDVKFKNAVVRVTSVGIGTTRVLQKRADLRK